MITKFKSKKVISDLVARYKDEKRRENMKRWTKHESRIYLFWQEKGLEHFNKENTYTSYDVFKFMKKTYYEIMEQIGKTEVPDDIKNGDDMYFAHNFKNWQKSFEKLFVFEKQKISEYEFMDMYDDDLVFSGEPYLYSNITVN